MKKYKKISNASIRVLETLKVLSCGSASIQDIIRHFEKIDPNNRIYTNEVILKYINTLKVFQLRFIKQKDKYVLLNALNQIDFNEKDLIAYCLIEKFAEMFPEEKIKAEIKTFLYNLEKRFSNNTKLLLHNLTKPDFVNLEFDYSKYSTQIKEYEKYCIEKQRLKVTYRKQNKIVTSVMIEPNEIKYLSNQVYLSVYNPLSAQIQDINFNSILKIEQLPLKSNFNYMYSSVIFCLKDRLASAYKLHDGEELMQLKSDGSIIILNKKEDQTFLLKRLMRYGEYCEVISPKSLQKEIKQIIKATLSNYY